MPGLIISSYDCELGWHTNKSDYWDRCHRQVEASRRNDDPIAHVRFDTSDITSRSHIKPIVTSVASEPVFSLLNGSLFDYADLRRWITSQAEDDINLVGCFSFHTLLTSMLDARSHGVNLTSPYDFVRLNTPGAIPSRQIIELCSTIPTYHTASVVSDGEADRCTNLDRERREQQFATARDVASRIKVIRESIQLLGCDHGTTHSELNEALGTAEIASLRWLTEAGLAANKIGPLLIMMVTEEN